MFGIANLMGDRLQRFFGILPFLVNGCTCVLIVVSLSTTGWFYHKDSSYGLFQRCWITESGRRDCKNLDGGTAEKTASICLLVSLVLHFVATVVSFLGHVESRKKNYKIAGVFSTIAVFVICGGSGTYAGMAILYTEFTLRYSFYVSVGAVGSSLFSTILSFSMLRFDENPKKININESLTEVTVLT
uniref:uncharacterized protein LOC120344605 n=1 Tax=Styela clava TaxID=7725 RepID=UPI00193A377C|nr:uncharacterized protein LOC120344605 [Styela clava]